MKGVLLVPAEDGSTSVVVLDEAGTRAVRRLTVAHDLTGRGQARSPPSGGELRAELLGDLLCLEYREP